MVLRQDVRYLQETQTVVSLSERVNPEIQLGRIERLKNHPEKTPVLMVGVVPRHEIPGGITMSYRMLAQFVKRGPSMENKPCQPPLLLAMAGSDFGNVEV